MLNVLLALMTVIWATPTVAGQIIGPAKAVDSTLIEIDG